MLTEDKKRFDLFKTGLSSMGLTIKPDIDSSSSNIKSWVFLGKGKPIARVFYEPDKPFNERFSFQPARSRQES